MKGLIRAFIIIPASMELLFSEQKYGIQSSRRKPELWKLVNYATLKEFSILQIRQELPQVIKCKCFTYAGVVNICGRICNSHINGVEHQSN